MENKEKKKSRFRIFDLQREGKGISKNSKELTPGFKRFFISYKDNFGKLVSVNIFYVLGNFPLFFLIATLSGVTQNSAFLPASDLFNSVFGLFNSDASLTPYELSMLGVVGLQNTTFVPTALTYVFYGLGALSLFTFGIVNVGCAYILRNLVSGEPVFIWSDFWYAVKRNWKQALPFGMVDILICTVLGYDIYSYFPGPGATTGTTMLFWTTVILFILYFFMRYYIYVQMLTFKLTVFKILKNSFIFALIGFKRNIVALLAIVLLVFLELLLIGTPLVPLGVAAPLAILFSTLAYIKVYAGYFKIKTVMIDPYVEAHPELYAQPDDDEVVMRDDVTERERLEEIKRRNGIID